MARVNKDTFSDARKKGIEFPNKLIIKGGDDAGKSVNANQIDWGTSYFLGSELEQGTTQEVLTMIEDIQITYNNVWETF